MKPVLLPLRKITELDDTMESDVPVPKSPRKENVSVRVRLLLMFRQLIYSSIFAKVPHIQLDHPVLILLPCIAIVRNVYVRIRPLRTSEQTNRAAPCIKSNATEVSITQIWVQDQRQPQNRESFFSFHGVYKDMTPTPKIYQEVVAPLVASVISGFNSTCFAYGMTGAGKTHTMFGDMYFAHVREPGVVPLALNDLFSYSRQRPGSCVLRLSYLEIYNEQVRDLLVSKMSNRPQGLLLVEDPEKGVLVTDLTEFVISSVEEGSRLVVEGNSRRTMAATGANQHSSRSHAVLLVSMELRTEGKDVGGEVSNSKMCLIDLAGSERAAATENRGVRLLEGANINRSLLALGNCINILSDPEKTGKFVPYRDSKLTRLLKDALGGKTRTVMIACVSPGLSAYEETLHTLKYAERARRIKVTATRNVKEVEVHVSEYKAIIASLKAEVETLKEQIRTKDYPGNMENPPPQPVSDPDGLGQELMRNFEEFWELKQSIQEVETLNQENKKQVKALIADLEYVESLNDEAEEHRLKAEIKRIHENVKENEDAHNELLQNLQQNMKAKSKLQRQLSALQDDIQRDMLQLQITVRTLKMEKMDLYIQNQEMKQQVVDSRKISDEKEKLITALRLEVEEMKRQLSSLPYRLNESDLGNEALSPKNESLALEQDLSISRTRKTRKSFASVSMSPLPEPHPQKPHPSVVISDLNRARALRKSESQRAVQRSESSEGFLSSFLGSSSRGDETTVLKDVAEQLADEEIDLPPKSVRPGVKVASVLVVNKRVKSMRKVHDIRPIKQYGNLQRVRSSSNTRSRNDSGNKVKSQVHPVRKGEHVSGHSSNGSGPIVNFLASLHQKILTGEETETLVRKTLKHGNTGETPMVAISLRKNKPAFKH